MRKLKTYILICIITVFVIVLSIIIDRKVMQYESVLKSMKIPSGEKLPEYSNFQRIRIAFHSHNYETKKHSATCTKEEYIKYICDCGAVKFEITNPPTGHFFGEYIVTKNPTKTTDGEKTAYCSICKEKDVIPYHCDHINIVKNTIKAPTCTEEGEEEERCAECGALMNVNKLPILDHSFAVKEIIKLATPLNPGRQIKECTMCGLRQEISYNITMKGPNSLYIPGVINAKFIKASFEQSSVDNNDIIYALYRGRPVILGHDTGSIGSLYNTRVGQTIYVSLDGIIKSYKVVVSEQGFDQDMGIIGVNGNRLMQDGNYLGLHICYNTRYNKDSRWFILATEI